MVVPGQPRVCGSTCYQAIKVAIPKPLHQRQQNVKFLKLFISKFWVTISRKKMTLNEAVSKNQRDPFF